MRRAELLEYFGFFYAVLLQALSVLLVPYVQSEFPLKRAQSAKSIFSCYKRVLNVLFA